jgi:drug/metabolite transporter (DMT)-like permease
MPRLPLPLLLLLVTGTLIGTTFPLGRLSGEAGVPPLVWAFLTSGGSALALSVALLAAGRRLPADTPNLRFYLLGGLISYALPNFLVFSTIPHLGAGFTSIMFTLSPIVTLILATLLGTRRTTLLGIAGIAVGFAGALMIVLGKGELGRPAEPLWLAVAFLIPVSLAIGNIYRTVAWPPGTTGLQLAVGTNLAAACALLVVILIGNGPAALATLANAPELALAQATASSIMFAFFFRLQVAGGPVYLSQIGYVAAAVGLGSGTLFLGESYGLATWLGALVIAAGVIMTTLAQKPT